MAGEITGGQVAVIAQSATPGNLDRAAAQDIDLGVVEEAFVAIAVTQPHSTLQMASAPTCPGSTPTAPSYLVPAPLVAA